jgi:hypothetical protein
LRATASGEAQVFNFAIFFINKEIKMMNQINITEDDGILRTGGFLLLALLAAASLGWFLYKNSQGDESAKTESPNLIDTIKRFFTNPRKINVETLTFRELVSWFVANQDNYVNNGAVCGFSLSRKNSGKYETIQGYFDKSTSKVLGGRVIISSDYDEELSAQHKDNELVIYE